MNNKNNKNNTNMNSLRTIVEEDVTVDTQEQVTKMVRPPRANKPKITYWAPDRLIPSLQSLADMEMPNPALLCDQHNTTFCTTRSSLRESNPCMRVINDYFDMLGVLAESRRWVFTDWETNETINLNLRESKQTSDDVDDGSIGDVVDMESNEVIGTWSIQVGAGSFAIVQECDDVTTLRKECLKNRVRINYKNKQGIMRENFMYIVENEEAESYYLQEEKSWFRIVCDKFGKHSVKMVDIFGRPVRSAVQFKKVVLME